jgi:hypothetical protein
MLETIIAVLIALVLAPIVFTLLPWILLIGVGAIAVIIGGILEKRVKKQHKRIK